MEKFVLPVLIGPTASGKTELALKLAQEMPLEIISMDSGQVYQGMDIGTAKPTQEERKNVRHHLLDIIPPEESYSVACFCEDLAVAVGEIRARGRVPLVVGGTMLYFEALQQGLSDLPPANAVFRAQLEQRAAQEGWHVLHQELRSLEPATQIGPKDTVRITRALEIIHFTGRKLEQIYANRRPPRFQLSALALHVIETEARARLYERIDQRFSTMLSCGLVEEVKRLRARGTHVKTLPALKVVGYRQVWDYLEGRFDEDELKRKCHAATHQFARRQLLWLRTLPGLQHVGFDSPHVIDVARNWLEDVASKV